MHMLGYLIFYKAEKAVDLECINRYEWISLIKSLIYRSAEETSFCAFTQHLDAVWWRLSTNLKGHGSEPPDSTNESAVFSSPCCKGNQENGMTKPTIVPITYTACHSKAFWLDVLSTARCKDTHSRFTPSRKVFDMQITACHMWLLSPLWLTACLVLNIWRSPNCVPTDLRGFSLFLLNLPL